MKWIILLALVVILLALWGCRTPEQPAPEAPNDGDTGDGLEIVAPGGGGETLRERLTRSIN